MDIEKYNIAVLIPCFNEALTVEKVVRDFKKNLPAAQIFVFDNNSKDETAIKAQNAGAIVIPSKRQGKGHVVRHMFYHIKAHNYLMEDGDE
ncbi:MAG: glycosyltransferase, partial [Candidatus Poribacteria bacterium]